MIITAKFNSICPCCNTRIEAGSKVDWEAGSKARHVACAAKPGAIKVASVSSGSRRVAARRGGAAAPVAGYSSYCTGREGCRCYDCE